MWDIAAQALDFRVTILVLTTWLTSLGFQSLTDWVCRAFRTTDQFAKHFYHDLDGESTFKDVQATIKWQQRVIITILTTSAGAVSLSRAVIVSTREEWLHCGILVSNATFFCCNSLVFTDWISFYCSFNVSPC